MGLHTPTKFLLRSLSLDFFITSKTITSLKDSTEDSITCEDTSDDSSLDSSSICSSTDCHVRDEEERRCEIEYRAAITIQGTWCQWIKRESTKRQQLKIELHASQIVINVLRTWLMRQRLQREENAALTIQDAWLSWIIAEKQRRQIRKEILAVAIIQVNWRNYHAKLCRLKAREEKEAKFIRYQNMAFATGLAVFSHFVTQACISH